MAPTHFCPPAWILLAQVHTSKNMGLNSLPTPDDAVHNGSCVDPETTEILLDQILCAGCTLPPSSQGENG